MLGRKASMLIGGLFFLVGSLLNGFAMNIEMLIIGRLFLGIGVGFCNQVRINISYTYNHLIWFVFLYFPRKMMINFSTFVYYINSLYQCICLKWLHQKLEEHSILASQ